MITLVIFYALAGLLNRGVCFYYEEKHEIKHGQEINTQTTIWPPPEVQLFLWPISLLGMFVIKPIVKLCDYVGNSKIGSIGPKIPKLISKWAEEAVREEEWHALRDEENAVYKKELAEKLAKRRTPPALPPPSCRCVGGADPCSLPPKEDVFR